MAEKPKAGRTQKPTRPEAEKPETEKEQRERFIEAARELGVDETGEEFERLFKKVVAKPAKRDDA